MSHLLGSNSPVSARSRKSSLRPNLIALAAAVLLAIAGIVSPRVHESRVWVDSVTRSQKRQSIWLGIALTSVVENSPLDLRLEQLAIRHTPNWCPLSDTSYNLCGVVTRACSLAPPIYSLPESLLDNFAKTMSDDQIRRFSHVMEFGTDSQQQAAIDAAANRALKGVKKGSDVD